MKKFLQLVIIVGILIYLFKDIRFEQLYVAIKSYSFVFSLITILIIFGSYIVLALRWNYLTGGTLGFFGSFETVVVADFLNIVLPARIGDLSKVFYLKKYYKRETHDTLSALFVERFLDITVLLLFAIIISFIYTQNQKLKTALFVLLLFVCGFLLIIKTDLSDILLKLIPIAKVRNYSFKVIRGINERLGLSSFGISLLYTGALWITYFLKNVTFFKYAAGFHLNLFKIFILFAVSTVSFTIPVTPGGLGTYQASVVFVATLYGVEKEEALLSGILLQFLQILVTSLLFGIIFLKRDISIWSFKNIKGEENL